MSELKVNFIVENLNKVKQSLENISIGGSESKSGSSSGSSGTTTAILSGGFAFLGGFLGSMLGQLQSVTGLLNIIAGFINSLVAPFVPILLGLFKPVFVLLNIFLQKVLKSFQGDGVGGLGIFGNVLTIVIAGLVAIAGAIAGAPVLLIGAITTATVGLVVLLFGWAQNLGTKARDFFDKSLANFNNVLDKGLASLVDLLSAPITKLGNLLGVDLMDNFTRIVNILKNVKDNYVGLLNSIINLDFQGIVDNLSGLKDSFKALLLEGFFYLLEILIGTATTFGSLLGNALTTVINFIINVFNGFIEAIRGAINAVIRYVNRIVPFSNISTVRSQGNISNISINIEGSADANTVNAVVDKLRNELARRGSI